MTDAPTASDRIDHLAHEIAKLRVRLAASRRLPAILAEMNSTIDSEAAADEDQPQRDMFVLGDDPFWVSYQTEGPGTATVTTHLTAPAGEAPNRALVQVRVENAAGEAIDLKGPGVSHSSHVGPYIYLPTDRRETEVRLRIPVPEGAAKLALGFRTWGAKMISLDRNLTAEIDGRKLPAPRAAPRIVGHLGRLVADSSVDWERLSQIAAMRPGYTFEITEQASPTGLHLPTNVAIVGGQGNGIREISSRWSAAFMCLRGADGVGALDGRMIAEHLAPGLPIVSLRSPHIRDYRHAWTVHHQASLVALLDEVMS